MLYKLIAMETKHEKIVNVTRRISLLSLALIFVVRYFDKGNYSDESTIAVVGLVVISTLAVLYRWNYEIKHGIFELKKYLPMIVFVMLSVVIFILFATLE